MKVLAVTSYFWDPPGVYLGRCAHAHGVTIDDRRPLEGDSLPPTDAGFDGLIIMGGKMSATDRRTYPHLERVIDLVGCFHETAKPILGVCLGAQLIAVAYGAPCHPLDAPEAGFTRLTPTPAAGHDPLVDFVPEEGQDVLEFHWDTFDLPKGAVLLLRGAVCEAQAFRLGVATYGFQPHFEAAPDRLRGWLDQAPGQTFKRQDAEAWARVDSQVPLCETRNKPFCLAIGDRWFRLVTERSERDR